MKYTILCLNSVKTIFYDCSTGYCCAKEFSKGRFSNVIRYTILWLNFIVNGVPQGSAVGKKYVSYLTKISYNKIHDFVLQFFEFFICGVPQGSVMGKKNGFTRPRVDFVKSCTHFFATHLKPNEPVAPYKQFHFPKENFKVMHSFTSSLFCLFTCRIGNFALLLLLLQKWQSNYV